MDSMAKAYESTTRSISLMLSLIGSIALMVGGVGVMNIMLVSVTGADPGDGIRMAVGARRADIARQFLAEAVAICLIGGAAGVALALLSGTVFSAFVKKSGTWCSRPARSRWPYSPVLDAGRRAVRFDARSAGIAAQPERRP